MRPLRPLALVAVILLAAASRLLPHPPNFTPIGAIALFGGAHLRERWQAFVVPLAAMVVSDLIIGWHQLVPLVYGSFALTVVIGMWLHDRKTMWPITGAALTSSVLFFIVTNFGVWALGSMYAKTLSGLVAAYVAAIPFFRNTVTGDLFYTAVLFGGFGLLERLVPQLREQLSPRASQVREG
jgi:hypothetical protein